jgi:nitrite reductase/ring-hydroxylating ferredoxin subunit
MSEPVRKQAKKIGGEELICVGTLDELKTKGMTVVAGGVCPLLVVHDRGHVFALDNRCPHLGFPLHRGSVEDGVLTCHWHHARFDLRTGGTFDLWADDVPTAAVELRKDGTVWVGRQTRYGDGEAHWRNRLQEGLQHDISLVLAKAVLGLVADGVDHRALVRDAVMYGVHNRDGWGTGLTILTALANLVPSLPPEETYLALFQGLSRLAHDCDGAPSRRDRQPLSGDGGWPLLQLGRWLRHWTSVRHREGAERTLLTAIASCATSPELATLLLTAVTDRTFADGGHALDFVNKSFECVDLIGWEHAAAVLPTTVAQLADARGGEETNAWRHPVDLIALCEAAFTELPALLAKVRPSIGRWNSHTQLARDLLADDPAAIIAALNAAIRDGADPADLGRALAYAAALRVAWFGTANEHSDWEAAHHAFTYCNAVHQLLQRATSGVRITTPDSLELLRGVFHGAMRLYLIRFLNVPPARLAGEDGDRLDDLPTDAALLREAFLTALDRQGSVREAGRIVARYLILGHPADALIVTLARAVLREDADFHTFQMLEAGVRQYREWGGDEGRHILIAVARYLAAHSPTERARLQTAMVARRLSLGQALHEGEPTAA